MRQSLRDLIDKTIIYKYNLPDSITGTPKTIYSTEDDKCYSILDKDSLVEIIYNSIVEYSFNEFDLTLSDFNSLHAAALRTKLKYNELATKATKLKYGFFGEVLLYSILMVMFKAKPLIARGYFYNPLENSETKGYDSYQLIEDGDTIELWFGEVKFHKNHGAGLKSIINNMCNVLSDSYLERNILSLTNQKNNFNILGSKIENIIRAWELNPSIKIIDEIIKYNIKLVYPILLLYEDDGKGYDGNIKKIPEHIVTKYKPKSFKLTVDYSIFFILVPIEAVKAIKSDVIKWIELKKPLMS